MGLRLKPKCLKVEEDEAGRQSRLGRSALHPAVVRVPGRVINTQGKELSAGFEPLTLHPLKISE